MNTNIRIVVLIIVTLFYGNLQSQVLQKWASRYNGLGNGIDKSYSIALDDSGNVYVTGESAGIGTNSDFATVKYNSLGIQKWASIYNGPGNSADRANAIVVDKYGNVYVTGTSGGIGTSSDYATIKYNSSGVQQWVTRYNSPTNQSDYSYAIAIDDSGNVYVTGHSTEQSPDYVTIKYNSLGVQQWVARYDSPSHHNDEAWAIAVDSSGNVYVTGDSKRWGTGIDCATIKYNSSGAQQWIASYNWIDSSEDVSSNLVLDDSGNVYVAGRSKLYTGSNSDYVTIKYNSSGGQQWVQRYNGPGNSMDCVNAIAVNDSGNVYVTGWSDGNGTYSDYATIKYNKAGIQQWVSRYNGTGNYDDQAIALGLDDAGNVYVTGESTISQSNTDFATIKYNSSGIQKWIIHYNCGIGNGNDRGYSIAVDNFANIYVTGDSFGMEGTNFDYATIKYIQTPNAPLLSFPINGAYNIPINTALKWYKADLATLYHLQLAIDSNFSNIIVNDSTLTDSIKTVTNLNIQTTYYWRVKTRNEEYFSSWSSIWHFTTIPNVPSAPTLISPPNGAIDQSLTPTLDWDSISIAAGYQVQVGSDSTFTNCILDSNGILNSFIIVPNGILINNSTYFWRVKAYNAGGNSQWSVIWHFTTASIGIEKVGEQIPKEFKLNNNFPNPFNPKTKIRFELPKNIDVKINVYNILGKEITTLIDGKYVSGIYEVDFDASNLSSGIYICRMIAGDYVSTKKMILLK
jgi:uncharacterized delta-60 repeat protein